MMLSGMRKGGIGGGHFLSTSLAESGIGSATCTTALGLLKAGILPLSAISGLLSEVNIFTLPSLPKRTALFEKTARPFTFIGMELGDMKTSRHTSK